MVATILSPNLLFTRRDVAEHVLVGHFVTYILSTNPAFLQDLAKSKPDPYNAPRSLFEDQELYKSFAMLVKNYPHGSSIQGQTECAHPK
jgi:hypothetical protein